MYEFVLNDEQLRLREEVRDLVRWVPRQLILDMDQDKVRFPKEFLKEAAGRNLLGCRHPRQWGGRSMDWVSSTMVMEEVGALGYVFACVFGVGADLVCDAIVLNGVFTFKGEMTQQQMFDYLCAVLCALRPHVRFGLAFNVASTHVDWTRDDLFHLPIGQVTDFVASTLSRRFMVRHDYGLYEYTVYVYL